MKAALELKSSVSGVFHLLVRNADGTLAHDHGRHKNLILPAGQAGQSWAQISGSSRRYCRVGTGTTPNKTTPDGTFQQTGTTVTRASGTGVFSSGNVNDFIKFSTGERAKITAYTNTVTVEVDRAQTVPAAALTVYDTSRITLDNYVVASNTSNVSEVITHNTDLGTTKYKMSWDLPTEVSAKSYTEIGVADGSGGSSQMLSRVVLDSAVNVAIGQFLQVFYEITCVMGNLRTLTDIPVTVPGWPRPYTISSIVANGSSFDIVTTEAHHYAVGRPVIISGALPTTKTVSTYASTGGDFTVTTAAAHGFSIGSSVVIAGASNASYNGTWTVATVPTSTTFTVTSGINPGAATGGTVRFSTPATWFNGTWTVASIPNSTTLRVTSAITPPAAGEGTLTNSTAAKAIISGYAFGDGGQNKGPLDVNGSNGSFSNYPYEMRLVSEANIRTGMQYGSTTSNPSAIANGTKGVSLGAYDVGNRKRKWTFTFASSEGNDTAIRQLHVTGSNAPGVLWITFDERQRKDAGYQLILEYTISWEPELD